MLAYVSKVMVFGSTRLCVLFVQHSICLAVATPSMFGLFAQLVQRLGCYVAYASLREQRNDLMGVYGTFYLVAAQPVALSCHQGVWDNGDASLLELAFLPRGKLRSFRAGLLLASSRLAGGLVLCLWETLTEPRGLGQSVPSLREHVP